MFINEILKLTDAGFTRDDIFRLLGDTPQEQPTQQEQHTPQEQPTQQEQTTQEQTAPSTDTRLDYIINRLNLMAVNNSSNPAPTGENVDDILASIINPTNKNKGV